MLDQLTRRVLITLFLVCHCSTSGHPSGVSNAWPVRLGEQQQQCQTSATQRGGGHAEAGADRRCSQEPHRQPGYGGAGCRSRA